jgi:hypothetical protein
MILEGPESHDLAMRIVSHVENATMRMQMIAEYQRIYANFTVQAPFWREHDAILPIHVND